LIILLGQAGWAVYTVYGKRVLAVHSPALATTAAYVLGSLMLLPVPFLTARLFPAPDWASPAAWAVVMLQAVLGAVAHVWWYEGVHQVGASRAGIFMNLQPVVGVVLAWIILGESIEPAEILGGLAVLAGVGMTTRISRAS
jgi:drug/metabolite transporter (DMT)-like permease